MSDTDIAKFATEGNRDLHILYGSQSGNSEGLAEKWQKEATKYGLTPTVHDMDGFDINSMSGMSRVMIVCSTWGEGEMPDNAEELYEAAVGVGKILTNTHFSICALGDTGYDFIKRLGWTYEYTWHVHPSARQTIPAGEPNAGAQGWQELGWSGPKVTRKQLFGY